VERPPTLGHAKLSAVVQVEARVVDENNKLPKFVIYLND
jgi:hypothetical protein